MRFQLALVLPFATVLLAQPIFAQSWGQLKSQALEAQSAKKYAEAVDSWTKALAACENKTGPRAEARARKEPHIMATDRQIAANRANSQRSTGPRDTSKTRHNALAWGLTAAGAVCTHLGETEEQFEAFQRDILDDIQPAGAREHQLATRFIKVEWQLNRIARIRTGLLEHYCERLFATADPAKPQTAAQVYTTIASIKSDPMARLSVEEQRLSNQSSRLTRELRQLQKDRQTAEKPLPENEANSEPTPVESATNPPPSGLDDDLHQPGFLPVQPLEPGGPLEQGRFR